MLSIASMSLACGGHTEVARVTIRSAAGPPLRIEEPPPLEERRVIARVRTAALATDIDRIYFGDVARDELDAAPKAGGERSRVGIGAPLEIAVGERVDWIGAPGNVVMTMRPGEPSRVLLRTRGVFTDVASDGPDVFVTDAMQESGVLTRITNTKATRLARFDARPVELALDAMNAYVLFDSKVVAVPRTGGEPRTVFEGEALRGLDVSGGGVFTTAMVGPSRALIRQDVRGGRAVVLQHAVREGPFAVFAGQVYYLEAEEPTIRRVATNGGASGIVARAPELARVSKLLVDGSGIYLVTEDERGPLVLGLPRPG